MFKTFREIAQTSGSQSQERKKGLIVKLLVAAKGDEAGYIMRALQVRDVVCTAPSVCRDKGLAVFAWSYLMG